MAEASGGRVNLLRLIDERAVLHHRESGDLELREAMKAVASVRRRASY